MKFAITFSLVAVLGLVSASPVPQFDPPTFNSPCKSNQVVWFQYPKDMTDAPAIFACSDQWGTKWLAIWGNPNPYDYNTMNYREASADICANRPEKSCISNYLDYIPKKF